MAQPQANPFHAYDIRGIFGQEVTTELAWKIGYATAKFLEAKRLIVARDGRTSSEMLEQAVIQGMQAAGVHVATLGLATTPQFYFALYSGTADGGIMVTASHNPKEYNGFKICGANAAPIFADNGLEDIRRIASQTTVQDVTTQLPQQEHITQRYVQFFSRFKKQLHSQKKIIVDCGNGVGRLDLDALKSIYDEEVIMDVLYPTIDGRFPNHEANPVKLENTKRLQELLAQGGYDFGVALDGDADRIVCFLADGTRIEPDILTAVLGVAVTAEQERVGYEVRTSQSAVQYIEEHQRQSLLFRSGHAYIKAGMKEHKVTFAGEKSGHYFYQILHYTDSPLLTLMHLLHLFDAQSEFATQIKQLQESVYRFEEINYTVRDKDETLRHIKDAFAKVSEIETVDGVSCYGEDFFFNIRKSNTEPFLRLNLEAKTKERFDEIKKQIESFLE